MESTVEVFPVDAVGCNCKVNVTEEVGALSSRGHRASNLVPLDCDRLIDSTVEATERIDFGAEALARDHNVTAEAIRGATTREGFINLVQHEHETVLVIVPAVEGDLELHPVAFGPATW